MHLKWCEKDTAKSGSDGFKADALLVKSSRFGGGLGQDLGAILTCFDSVPHLGVPHCSQLFDNQSIVKVLEMQNDTPKISVAHLGVPHCRNCLIVRAARAVLTKFQI